MTCYRIIRASQAVALIRRNTRNGSQRSLKRRSQSPLRSSLLWCNSTISVVSAPLESESKTCSLSTLSAKSRMTFLSAPNDWRQDHDRSNLAHRPLTSGITIRFVESHDMLNEHIKCDRSTARRGWLQKYCNITAF